MDRIVILGGGVGGTLVANLLVEKLRRRLDRGEATVTVVDATGQHNYQPGFMYIAMGGERASNLKRPERSLAHRSQGPRLTPPFIEGGSNEGGGGCGRGSRGRSG